MFQLPVNNLTRLRKARKRVKRLLSDIGLDYCKEHVEDYKAFSPDEFYMKHFYLDICVWDPSWTKSQHYRTKQFCCSECPFASKYFSAYKNHFRNVHRDDFENRILLNCSYCMYSGNKRTLETHVRLFHMPYNVARQGIATSIGTTVSVKDSIRMDKSGLTDTKELPVYYCKKCNYHDRLYNVVRRHIFREHFQHLTPHHVVKKSQKPENNEEVAMSNHGIHCNRCLFVPRSYEALVQHIIEFHEHIGHQVTAMIGHTVILACSQRSPSVTPGITTPMVQPINCFNIPQVMKVPVGKHLRQGVTGSPGQSLCITLRDKGLVSNTASHSCTQKHLGSLVVKSIHGNVSISPSIKFLPFSSAHPPAAANVTLLQAKRGSALNAVNALNTQKGKLCTICNEHFPESVFTVHVEKEHQLFRVHVVAKYITKIHAFTSKCLSCNCYLPSETVLDHMLIHGLACPQCHSTFYKVENLITHKREVHPNEPGDIPIDSPLTFELTLQHGSPKNVQLIVTTYYKKKAPQSSYPVDSIVSSCTVGPKRPSESLRNSWQSVNLPKTELSKTLCALCFNILKGGSSNTLAQHLQDRHQVLQTFHPVEKKLTYKCIHCFGVYTGTMTASKITLHLGHCRGRGQGNSGICISALKRESVTVDTFDNKKKKTIPQNTHYTTEFVEKPEEPILILDPRGHAEGSYDARKAFLTDYFNRQPYPSQQEVEKLAASLWLWKSDVTSHFAKWRTTCEQDFVIRRPLVLLGFNMQEVNQLKHEMYFDCKWLFTVNKEHKSGSSRTAKKRSLLDLSVNCSRTPMMEALKSGPCNQISCAFKPLFGSSEPIGIHKETEQEVAVNDRTVKTASTFPSVQTWTREAMMQERFLYKRATNDFTEGGSKCLDDFVSASKSEEALWSGSISPTERRYRTAGRFEEKGQEIGLLGT